MVPAGLGTDHTRPVDSGGLPVDTLSDQANNVCGQIHGGGGKVQPQMEQFTSRLFKKDGSLRPIVNLKPLNRFMAKHHFKMEGICRVKELLREGDWMCSVDLKDAYLSVPVAKHHRKTPPTNSHVYH